MWGDRNQSKRCRRTGPQFCTLALESLEDRLALSVADFAPIAGEWNGGYGGRVGMYDNTDGTFYLRYAGNSTGFVNQTFVFNGTGANLLPVTGDFDGAAGTPNSTVGVFNTATGQFKLTNINAPNVGEAPFSITGVAGTLEPIAGKWIAAMTADGVGVYDRDTGIFYLRNGVTEGAADQVVNLGAGIVGFTTVGPTAADWRPLAGRFIAAMNDGIALYNVATGTIYVDNDLDGTVDITAVVFAGDATDRPIVGDWNNDGIDTLGVYDTGRNFHLKDMLSLAAPENVFFLSGVKSQTTPNTSPILSTGEVQTLLGRASAATVSQSAIIAVVDRQGRILGVRVEQAVIDAFAGRPDELVFAIDGAVALARTAAFFSNDTAALTSRTVEYISQSTITQREVQSNPNLGDPNSTEMGPGLVAPVGPGLGFPPGVMNTPQVDLFGIEHTNRDSLLHPGADGIKGTGDDIDFAAMGRQRFFVDPAFVPTGNEIAAPESYGFVTGALMEAQARGIGTLPGGIPIFRNLGNDLFTLLGGIGVFFPGIDGYADTHQGFVQGIGQTKKERMSSALGLEAEFIALAAIGGSSKVFLPDGTRSADFPPFRFIDGIAKIPGIDINAVRIDLQGITLDAIGPGAGGQPGAPGVTAVLQIGLQVFGGTQSGMDMPVDMLGNEYIAGRAVPSGWLVLPHDAAPGAGDLTAADVAQIINQGNSTANHTRAQIRDSVGNLIAAETTRMMFAVADKAGNVLGLYRMPDATYFSIDVAVAKARNTAYYADAAQLQPEDQLAGIAAGTAFSNRTFRFLATAHLPEGIATADPGPFSSLNDAGIDKFTAENLPGGPLAASFYMNNGTSVLMYDSFVVGSNFRQTANKANQNGIVFFPGSTPLYKNGALNGGFGVSGDGVDQDDIVTAFAVGETSGLVAFTNYFVPPNITRIDQLFYQGLRLPYFKFPRNAFTN